MYLLALFVNFCFGRVPGIEGRVRVSQPGICLHGTKTIFP